MKYPNHYWLQGYETIQIGEVDGLEIFYRVGVGYWYPTGPQGGRWILLVSPRGRTEDFWGSNNYLQKLADFCKAHYALIS